MKRTSKLFGAVALSAALAMGCAMPAFAVVQKDETGADGKYQDWSVGKEVVSETDDTMVSKEIVDGTEGGTNTPVYIDVKKSNINVAVPIELRLVAETAGGPLLTPTDGVYGVWNYSTNTAIYINKVEVDYNEVENKEGVNWELVTDPAKAEAGYEADAAKLGNLMVKLSAPNATDEYVLDVATPKVPTADKPWKVNKSGFVTEGDGTQTPTGTQFPLNFVKDSCTSSIVQMPNSASILMQTEGDEGKAAADAFKLKYTISTARPKA